MLTTSCWRKSTVKIRQKRKKEYQRSIMLFLVKLLRLENKVVMITQYSRIQRPKQKPPNGFLLKIWLTLEKYPRKGKIETVNEKYKELLKPILRQDC